MNNEVKTPWVEHIKTFVILGSVAGLAVAMGLVAFRFLGISQPIQTDNVDARISDIWASIQGIGLISGIIGVLITVLVLYFSLSNSAQISNAIADFEKQKTEIRNETRESLNRIKKEIRESSIEFRIEVEKRISEEDRHQSEIENKLNRIYENLQQQIRVLTIETSVQQRQLEIKHKEVVQALTNILKEIENAKTAAIIEINNATPNIAVAPNGVAGEASDTIAINVKTERSESCDWMLIAHDQSNAQETITYYLTSDPPGNLSAAKNIKFKITSGRTQETKSWPIIVVDDYNKKITARFQAN